MDARSYVIVFSCVTLMLSSGIYGWKFVKKGNYLLGFEWWAVTFSSSNLFNYLLTNSSVSYGIAHYMDAFSRGFGVPVIAVAGMMVLTHGYKPTLRHDVLFFGAAIAATFFIDFSTSVATALPYFYLVMWILLSVYLAYFVKKLIEAGELFHAFTSLLALVSCLVIASIYDFYKIPGDDQNVVFNFFTLALLTWSYFNAAIYYAYCALERRQAGQVVMARKQFA